MNSVYRRLATGGPLVAALLALLATLLELPPAHAVVAPSARNHALWVFPADPGPTSPPDPISDPTARQALIDSAAASSISTLYLSVYRNLPSRAGRYMYEDADIAAVIANAHAKYIKVYAAYGNDDWTTFGCDPNKFPLQRLQEVIDYNRVNAAAPFDGVMLDIEPALLNPPLTKPPTIRPESAYVALLAQYKCFQDRAEQSNLGLSVAISSNWREDVTYNSETKAFYKHVIDMIRPPNQVVVMGYRDFAGTTDPFSDGIVASDQDQIAYAASMGKYGLVLAGLETIDPATQKDPASVPDRTTFFQEGQSVLNGVAQAVVNQFGYYSGLGGFAVHNYGNSYLKGSLPKWPQVNTGLPFGPNESQEIATLLGAPMALPSATVATTGVTLTFQTVTTAGYSYVLPLDATSTPPLPANYLVVTNGTHGLAFDISTTASFSGAVKVCFSNIDATDFSTLQVLHYISGQWSDETLRDPAYAPNGSTRTVCASVNSFSPFVIARCVGKKDAKNPKSDGKCRKPDADRASR